MAGTSWWPLLLLGGGSTATTLLMIALMSNEGLLNNLLGWGKEETSNIESDTAITAEKAPATIYDIGVAEATSNGAISTTTAQLIANQQKADSDLAASTAAVQLELEKTQLEIDAVTAEADYRTAEADYARAQTESTRETIGDAAVGGVGGAVAGALLGAAATSWTGPGVLIGAGVGAIAGFLGVGALSEASQGKDWWPFW